MKSLAQRLILTSTLFLLLALPARGAKVLMPDGYVGHTRLAPVVVHRLFPPYRGEHVYLRPMPPMWGAYYVAPMPYPMPW